MHIRRHGDGHCARRARSHGTGLVRGRRRALVMVLPAALVVVAGCDDDAAPRAARADVSTAPATPEGNGVDGLSGPEILKRARVASLAATSLRIKGRLRENGQVMTMDVGIAGKNSATAGFTVAGQRIQVVRAGSTVYVKGDAGFWRSVSGKAAARLLAGKYMKTTVNDEKVRDLVSPTFASKVFADILRPEGAVTKHERIRVNGRAAIALGDGTGGKLYVATEGDPHVLRLTVSEQTLDFLAYNEPVNVQVPPRDSVIDVAELR